MVGDTVQRSVSQGGGGFAFLRGGDAERHAAN